VKLIGCEPITEAPEAAAVTSGPLALATFGGVLSSSVNVMLLRAGTALASAKVQLGELSSVVQLTYASKSRAPCGSVQLSLAVYGLEPP
jgi:hypothetical protein